MKTILILISALSLLASIPSVRATDEVLEMAQAVAADLDSFFGDTVNEGDRTARVNWKTVEGRALPRVSCVQQVGSRYLCEAQIKIKIEEVTGYAMLTCADLPYERMNADVVRVASGEENPFTSCLEDISSAEVD